MTTDFRALCAELTEKLDDLNCSYNIPSQSALVERARAELAQPKPRADTCTGCGSSRVDVIRAVAGGAIACCPDCSTLTMADRNEIRRIARETPALSQPEPEGPTLAELDDLCEEHCFNCEDRESLECLLSVITDALARWGRPAPQPAADGEVADRLIRECEETQK